MYKIDGSLLLMIIGMICGTAIIITDLITKAMIG